MLDAATLSGVAALWKQSGHEISVTVEGGSMLPSLHPGDQLQVRFTDDFIAGDVVMFLWPGGVGLHRVIAAGRDVVITQGDAMPFPDPPLRRSDILGVAVGAPPAPARLRRFSSVAKLHVPSSALVVRALLAARRAVAQLRGRAVTPAGR